MIEYLPNLLLGLALLFAFAALVALIISAVKDYRKDG